MKLIYYVIIRISLVLSVLLTGWAILFYFAVMDEVNDEVDDSLEDYSEIIIIRALAGEEDLLHSGTEVRCKDFCGGFQYAGIAGFGLQGVGIIYLYA